MATKINPRHRRVAKALRTWRDKYGATQDQVHKKLDWTGAKLSKFENSTAVPKSADVIALATIYGISEAERDQVVDWLNAANSNEGWWTIYAPGTVPDWVTDYLDTETDATSLQIMEMTMIPGLLQTAPYTEALIRTETNDEHLIEERRQFRRQRQARLDDETEPLQVHTIVNELALTTQISGPEVMREQCSYLLKRAEQSNITVQVLPLELGGHPAFGSSFRILWFDSEQTASVYVELYETGMYVEDTEKVNPFILVFERLRDLALDPEMSLDRINKHAQGQ